MYSEGEKTRCNCRARLGDDKFYLMSAGAAGWHDIDWLTKHLPKDGSVRIGNLSGAVAYNSYMDRMIFDGSDEPAVLASSTPWIYYDNGTSWIDVSGSLYYDNGTSWELVVVGTPVP